MRHGDAGRWPRLPGSARDGRGRSTLRAGQCRIFRAWLDPCDALRGPVSHARLLRLEFACCVKLKNCSDCSALDSGISWSAFRPEDTRVECICFCRDVLIQRGDRTLRHGARPGGAPRLRSSRKHFELAAKRRSAPRNGAARGLGTGLCSAGRTWRRDVQPGDAVLPCPCRAAACRTSGA